MQRLEVSGAVRPINMSLGFKRLINFTFNNHEIFQTNSSIRNNTRNRHRLHQTKCQHALFLKKNTFYAAINIFSSSPPNVAILRNDMAQFTAAFKNTYKHTDFILQMNFLCTKIINII